MLPNKLSHRTLLKGEPSTSRKRTRTNTAKKCHRVKKKLKMGDTVGQNATLPVDYISRLPDHIIHYILGVLSCPKDVVRTSTLSTKWRTIWKSFPMFDFDQKNFKRGKLARKQFVDFVESSLTTRLVPMEFIEKFRLNMTSCDAKKMTPRLDRWLTSIVTKNVKEMEIHLLTKKILRYNVPQSILTSESLTTLKLYGCKLDICDNMKLSNLKQFSMKNMHVDTHIIQGFLSSCPLIEDLRLVRCSNLDSLTISNNVELSRVEIHECGGLRKVEVSAPNLRVFWFCGKLGQTCTVDLNRCHDLRSVTLKDTGLTDSKFHDFITKLHFIETLVLKGCNSLERISILSEKLQRLSLVDCRKLVETIIDAPNLNFFEFTGNSLPVFCINAPNLRDVKMCFTKTTRDVFDVQKVVGKITGLKGLKLVLRRNKNVVIYEELKDVIPNIQFSLSKNEKLDLKSSSFGLLKHIENLLSETHPTSVSVYSHSSGELLKFLQEKMLKREKSVDCCTYYPRKCWRHYLKDVNVSEIQGRDSEHPFFPASKNLKRSTFSLEWEPMKNNKYSMSSLY